VRERVGVAGASESGAGQPAPSERASGLTPDGRVNPSSTLNNPWSGNLRVGVKDALQLLSNRHM